RTIVIAMDTSASLAYGSDATLKQETIQDVAAALACIAHENKDNVGLLLFNNTVHTTLPPKKGHAHLSTLLENIYNQPFMGHTNFTALGDYLLKHQPKNMVLVIVSDWLFDATEPLNNFKTLTKLYDVIAIRVTDSCELQLPDIGYIEIRDPETGALALVNTQTINHFLREQQASIKHFFDRNRMSTLHITAGTAFIPPLASFLQYRTRR
ncbi:VWA domain-containing protein, partial [Candidatus Dependentiae bacterium]|nr:VWA domain-containing protein [Candidatus Dependentiae bacterium]